MKSRKFSLRSLVRKVLGKRPAPAVTLDPEPPPRTSARERVRSGIEPLEGRIAPAILLNPHTLIYTDNDGDKVKIIFSKDLYDVGTTPANLNEIFVFSAGGTHIDATGTPNQTDDVPQQLQLINLTKVSSKLLGGRLVSRVAGISISVNADVAGSGDGLTKIGAILAGSDPLGIVKIDGDLGQIDAGNNAVKTGLERLEVQSIAKFGVTTQSTAPDLESRILGRLGALVVAGDVQGYIHVVTATSTTAVTQRGTIGSIVIGGSLIGSNAATGSANTGRIDSSYDIGTVVIGNDPSEGIFGGAGTNSGALTATHNIGTVTISGGITGGTVADSGLISAGHAIGVVKIGGALTGGSGLRSGSIHSGGPIGNVTISGPISGGTVADAGTISATGPIGFVKVDGALTGGGGLRSGSIRATGPIGSVTIAADVSGGTGDSSGLILTERALGSVHVFGGITGNGTHSGGIFASGAIGSAAVEGSLTGGANSGSGAIESLFNLGTVFIRGNVQGGDGAGSGSIIAASVLGQVTIDGNLTGGKGADSGAILGGHDPAATARSLGSVTLLGALAGGEGVFSGSIVSGGAMGAVKVGRSLSSGVAIQGGIGPLSGSIFSDGAIASVRVFGGIAGGTGAQSATIQAHGALGTVGIIGDITGGSGESSGSIFSHEISTGLRPIPGDIGTVVVIGKLMGTADRTALIQADGILGRATVGGIRGGAGSFSGAIVSGAGFIRPGATEFISVLGTVEGGAGAHSGSVEIGGQLGTFTATGLTRAGIRVAHNIGLLRISGDVSDSTITARGTVVPGVTDVAIGAVQVIGNVSNTSIRAGYDILDAPVNAHAQIGAVGVTGNWTASVLAAGVVPGPDGLFGNADDRLVDGAGTGHIISKIARVLIRGIVEGTPGAGDHFGFVAQQIGSFSSNGALPRAAVGGQSFELGTNSDTTVRAVPLVF